MKKYRKTYSGKWRPKNIGKYAGDATNIVYRSSWERQFFRWCDSNPNVIKWGSETLVIPYICKTDNRLHRYFVDVKVTFKNGETWAIEIKPACQSIAPKKRQRKSKKYLTEVATYVKNTSKWDAATKYCEDRGWKFAIFTEHTLRKIGIKII